MIETSYYQKNNNAILSRSKEYYYNNIDELREKARNKYGELPKEEKYIRRENKKIDIIICP